MKLDLITNKKSMVGSINPNDEFYTPNYAIEPIIKYLKPGSKIHCPFDTSDSNYVKLLRSKGFRVTYGHLESGNDFFKETKETLVGIDYIISNPPYSIKAEVFMHLFNIGIPFAMLVGVVGLFESKKRYTMFSENEFEIMYFDKRISYFRDYIVQKTSINPPFSSVYICSGILPKQIVFEIVDKKT